MIAGFQPSTVAFDGTFESIWKDGKDMEFIDLRWDIELMGTGRVHGFFKLRLSPAVMDSSCLLGDRSRGRWLLYKGIFEGVADEIWCDRKKGSHFHVVMVAIFMGATVVATGEDNLVAAFDNALPAELLSALQECIGRGCSMLLLMVQKSRWQPPFGCLSKTLDKQW